MKKNLLQQKVFYNGQNRSLNKTLNKTHPDQSKSCTKSTRHVFKEENASTIQQPVWGNIKKLLSGEKNKIPEHTVLPRIQTAMESSSVTKIFGPNPAKLDKISLLKNLSKAEIKRGKYGTKTLEQVTQKVNRFGWHNWQKSVQSWFLKIKFYEKFNQLVVLILVSSLFLFVIYLTFFDRFFLVKNFEITFAPNSYLDQKSTIEVVNSLSQNMFLGFIPTNQFWFLNDQTLTSAAQKNNFQIIEIKLVDRQWPNKAKIEITTQPILITLGLNSGQEYWRIDQSGKIASKDEANLRENLVVVASPITITHSNLNPTTINTPASFADYSFQARQEQLNRFWFIVWLWEQLKDLQIKYIKTAIPSLSDFDTDVIITTSNNTELWFDMTSGDRQNIRKKMNLIFNSVVEQRESSEEIKYIDFRTPKRVFVCDRNAKCAN